MIVEDKILEYLDGSLGERESTELLETLAVSPEKRALLEEHLRLKDILALGRKPYSVPLATEQALAERLSILSPKRIVPIPFGFRSGIMGIRQWVGSRAIQTAMVAAALLAVSFFAWSEMQPSSPQLASSGQQSLSANSGAIPENTGTNDLNDARDVNNAPTANTNSSATISRQAGHSSANIHAMNNVPKNAQDVNGGNGGSTITTITTKAQSTPNQSASSKVSQTELAASKSGASDEQPIHSVSNLSQSDIVIPEQSSQARTLNEFVVSKTHARNSATIGAYITGNNSYLPHSPSIPASSIMGVQPAVTLDCDILNNFEIGLEVGQEIYAALNDSSGAIQGSTYTRVNYSGSVTPAKTYYFFLTTHYTIAPENGFPFRLGLEGGIASTGQPAALATAGISRALSENLLLDIDAVYSWAWGMTPPSAISSIPSTGGVEGIVHSEVPSQKTYTSGVGIRTGLRFRL